ncbi:mucin-associated surface protein (MASP), putative, partial [Trypanosoma cruzi marinkellei]
QVTGVMAMMMTGRVLLVCALCVLWCVAVGGGCAEVLLPDVEQRVDSASIDGVPDSPTGHTTSIGAGGLSAQQIELEKVGVSQPGSRPLQAASEPELPTVQAHTSSQHTDSLTHSPASGKDLQEVPPADPPGRTGVSPSQEKKRHQSIKDPERNDPSSSSNNNNNVSSKSEELAEDTLKNDEIVVAAPSKEGREGENVTTSLEQSQGNSTAARATTTQTISMTSTDDSDSTTVNMTEAAPQPTGTAQTNHTATLGDSDGSTAVSHTTPPLLLLLVV